MVQELSGKNVAKFSLNKTEMSDKSNLIQRSKCLSHNYIFGADINNIYKLEAGNYSNSDRTVNAALDAVEAIVPETKSSRSFG